MGAFVVCVGGKLGKQDCADYECQAHGQVPPHDELTTANLIDDQHEKEFANEANDGVDGLVAQSVGSVNADLFLMMVSTGYQWTFVMKGRTKMVTE